jgi:hypothetical protein
VRFRKADVIYIEDFYRELRSVRRSANGGTIRGMLDDQI